VDYYTKELEILILFDGKHELRNTSTVFEELEVSIVDLRPSTLHIQYCYSYSYEILPTCTHLFENIQINDEIYALFKFLPLKKSNAQQFYQHLQNEQSPIILT